MNWDLLTHPFSLGLGLGLVFVALLAVRYFGLAGEMRRLKRHLHDRMEIDAEAVRAIKTERDTLKGENENLRIQITGLKQPVDRQAERSLEIYARAEKRMLISVPGFAPAWESAKSEAAEELAAEEAGRAKPKRIFERLFGGNAKIADQALPEASVSQS